MFETAVLERGAGRGAWGLAGSITLQAGAVAAMLAAGLMIPVAMPEPPEIRIAPPAPRFRDAVRVVATQVERAGTSNAMLAPVRRLFPLPTVAAAVPAGGRREVEFGELPEVGIAGGDRNGVPASIGNGPALPVAAPPPPPAAKPVETAVQRIAVGGQVLAAKIVSRPTPVYPVLARQNRIEGVVQLVGVISVDGRVTQLRVLSGHPFLVRAAVEAVSQWVYQPTLLNGRAVEVEAPIEVRFTLSR
jgi:periplasmic protein TonB